MCGEGYWRDRGLIKLLIMSDGSKQVQLCFGNNGRGGVGSREKGEYDVRLGESEREVRE